MKVHSVSDLHCDNWALLGHELATPELEVVGDLLVINGDVSDGDLERHLEKLCKGYLCAGKTVLFVPGNHDHYYRALDEGTAEMSRVCANLGVKLLSNSAHVEDGIRFYGTTLWAAFDLPQYAPAMQMSMAKVMVSDYRYVKGLIPQDTQALHHKARAAITHQGGIAKDEGEIFVLITHHAPLHQCIPGEFSSNPISGAYASEMSGTLRSARVHTAVYGHMHGTRRMEASEPLGCNLYINARGCLRGSTLEGAVPENPQFDYKSTFTV